MLFVSDAMTLARAAFFTDLLIEYATSARHASTQNPRKPRTAPTTIKTVPSGREDFCMNGASAVYGTIIVGIPAPATVGAAVSEKREPVAVPVVEVAEPVVVVAELAEDALDVLVAEVEVDLAEDDDEEEVFCVAVLRSGKSVSCALTEVARSSTSKPAAAVLTRTCDRILSDCVFSSSDRMTWRRRTIQLWCSQSRVLKKDGSDNMDGLCDAIQ